MINNCFHLIVKINVTFNRNLFLKHPVLLKPICNCSLNPDALIENEKYLKKCTVGHVLYDPKYPKIFPCPTLKIHQETSLEFVCVYDIQNIQMHTKQKSHAFINFYN